MLFTMFPDEEWLDLRIIDPACGTGGFLITVIDFLRKELFKREYEKWCDEEEARRKADETVALYAQASLFGIDINPILARTTQMNEYFHGNGSTNVFSFNSLLPPDEWPEDAQKRIRLGSFDMVLTNPPFGSKLPVDDPHILAQYDLGHVWVRQDGKFIRTSKRQASVPPERLFIERCLQFLKPKGKMAIVVPDSILSNPGLEYIRWWILKNARVLAVVDLPQETFLPWVGTKTSLLFLEKKTEDEVEAWERGEVEDYEIFMARARKVGHDRRGNPIYKLTPDGKVIEVEVERTIIRIVEGRKKVREKIRVFEPVPDDDLPVIAEEFKKWWRERHGG